MKVILVVVSNHYPMKYGLDRLGWLDGDIDNLGVFRDFINHLRTDDFAAETLPDWKVHGEVKRLHHREEDFYEGNIEERIEEFREYELQDIPFELIHAPWYYDSDLVFDYAMQINEYDAMCHPEEGDIDYADPDL